MGRRPRESDPIDLRREAQIRYHAARVEQYYREHPEVLAEDTQGRTWREVEERHAQWSKLEAERTRLRMERLAERRRAKREAERG